MSQKKILAIVKTWLGTPYHHQAALKGVGCDCLGLVRGVYEEACGHPAETPPPYSRDWAEASRRETMIEAAHRHLIPIDAKDAAPGDVLIFRLRPGTMAKHAAIMTGAPGARGEVGQRGANAKRANEVSPAKMIHAIEGALVSEVHITPWWRRRIAAVFRFPPQEMLHAQPLQQP